MIKIILCKRNWLAKIPIAFKSLNIPMFWKVVTQIFASLSLVTLNSNPIKIYGRGRLSQLTPHIQMSGMKLWVWRTIKNLKQLLSLVIYRQQQVVRSEYQMSGLRLMRCTVYSFLHSTFDSFYLARRPKRSFLPSHSRAV